jgi:hypothetical protein
VAAIFRYEFEYTEAMSADSYFQSSEESWIIQRESIQMYLMSSSREMEMAS